MIILYLGQVCWLEVLTEKGVLIKTGREIVEEQTANKQQNKQKMW